jgi:hypothetical protein
MIARPTLPRPILALLAVLFVAGPAAAADPKPVDVLVTPKGRALVLGAVRPAAWSVGLVRESVRSARQSVGLVRQTVRSASWSVGLVRQTVRTARQSVGLVR